MITNSPLIASINAVLAIPIIANSADGTQKRIKIEGYRGLLQKYTNGENQASYEIQLPFNSPLLTFRMENSDEAEVLKMAAQIPITQIAKMLQ